MSPGNYKTDRVNHTYQTIIKNNNLKMTYNRVNDFRKTMQEIVEMKNGQKPTDFKEDYGFNALEPRGTQFARIIKKPAASRMEKARVD